MVEHAAVNPSADGFQVRTHGRDKVLQSASQYTVYVLLNAVGKIYIGQTTRLAARLVQHNDSEYRGTLHTKRHPGPWRLVHAEQFPTRREAMRRERELKTSRGRFRIRKMLEVGPGGN